MASDPNKAAASAIPGGASASTYDQLLLRTLMSRLQIHPSYLDDNLSLSHSLEDFLLRERDSDGDDEEEDEEEGEGKGGAFFGGGSSNRRLLARQEAKLEKEIIRIVHASDAFEVFKANSGQSVSIGDHNICVSVHEEPGSEYRVWEWHGHIMLFDEENGYSAEYIYGNYFERLSQKKEKKDDDEHGNRENKARIKDGGNSGLRDLIEDVKNSIGNGAGRIIHRNSMRDESLER
ncbi:hypothetical protein Cni_G05651 [Canna indica]|uniref:Uncharacterized protein n=1 Tax=Canna indica TaxID=4628 RepID=A0AAQ3JX09_9LILI|nr:hypothetical protein Cni_G05651 [Canna indica]